MRRGCLVVAGVALLGLALAGGSLLVGFRIFQEPAISAIPGSHEDGLRAQQKLFEIVRGEPARRGARVQQVVITEGELNRFASTHLVEVAKMSVTIGALRLGDGIVEFKGLFALRDVLAASPLAGLAPASWLERKVWLHLNARASVEVAAARPQRRYLRFDVQRLALGRLPLPRVLLRLLPSPGLQGLLRWRLPDSVDGITIEPGAVVIRVAS